MRTIEPWTWKWWASGPRSELRLTPAHGVSPDSIITAIARIVPQAPSAGDAPDTGAKGYHGVLARGDPALDQDAPLGLLVFAATHPGMGTQVVAAVPAVCAGGDGIMFWRRQGMAAHPRRPSSSHPSCALPWRSSGVV
jgi:hypothetical protein